MKLSLQALLTLATALTGALPVAHADSGTSAADAGKLEEIVVTAQRREESAQNVGIALSVLAPVALAESGADKINGLQNLTPSLEIEPAFGSGQPQYRLRGVGFIDYTSNNTAAVGVTVDEVPLPFPIQTQGQIFDISRVEVLRGPQGTLYGLNTTGGAVNFVINHPTAETAAGISVDYGSWNALSAEGFASGAIAENLLGRLSLATEQGGAWQWNRSTGQKLGDKDKISGRAQLEWLAAPGTSVRLTLHSALDKSDEYGNQLISPFTPGAVGGGGAVIPADTDPYVTGWGLNPGFARSIGVSPSAKPGVDNSNNGANLDINADLGSVRLTSITSWDRFIRRELTDWDGTQYDESDVYFHDDISAFSEEVRLASLGSGPFGWVAGAFYGNDKLHENFYGDFGYIYGIGALTSYQQNNQSYGVFAQGSYQFSDNLKGILGLRPDRETRSLENLETDFIGSSVPASGPTSQSISNDSLSGKAELDYTLAKDALLYGSISRGVKSGGFTAHNLTAADPPFKPETLLAYELGVKADVTRSLRVNAAVFYYDYTDEQVLSKFLEPVTNSYIGSFINAPKSRIDGGEVEVDWVPGNGFELSQYLGYKEGKFTAPVYNSAGANFDGKDLDFPKLSYGGAVAYGVPVGGYRVRGEVNYSYHDKYDQLFLLENVSAGGQLVGAPQFQIDAYWLANASIGLSPAVGQRWTVSLWAHNVTNTKYYLTKNFFLPGNNIGQAGQPTTVGLHVDWKL
jgi:outer membrane receptor protein involved in Fe transport